MKMIMRETQKILDDAISYIVDKYGVDQALVLQLYLDNSIDDMFLDALSKKLIELSPDSFKEKDGYT